MFKLSILFEPPNGLLTKSDQEHWTDQTIRELQCWRKQHSMFNNLWVRDGGIVELELLQASDYTKFYNTWLGADFEAV